VIFGVDTVSTTSPFKSVMIVMAERKSVMSEPCGAAQAAASLAMSARHRTDVDPRGKDSGRYMDSCRDIRGIVDQILESKHHAGV
jgi:threonine dehydratase